MGCLGTSEYTSPQEIKNGFSEAVLFTKAGAMIAPIFQVRKLKIKQVK